MGGTPLRDVVTAFIQKTIADLQTTQGQTPNEQGVITNVNSDGTVMVQTESGVYTGCGTPVPRVMGEIVVLVTADQQKIAI